MNEFELEYGGFFVLEETIIYRIFGEKKITEEQKKEALDWFDFKGQSIEGDNIYKGISAIFSTNKNLLDYLEKNLDSKRGKERPWVFFKDDFKKFSEVINNFKKNK